MRILVTGGHGFLGRYVLPLLRGAIYAPRSREMDVTRYKEVEEVFKEFEPDVVLHMAAVVREDDPYLFRVNVDGTRNIVLASEAFDVDHIVFTSTAGVYGDTGPIPADEEREPRPETPYERSKLLAEAYVRKSTVPHTILRLALIVGPNRYWAELFNLVRKHFPIPGNGKQLWQLLYVEDAASAVAFAVSKRPKGTYNVAGEDAHSFNEIYAMMGAAMGLRRKPWHIPLFLARLLGFWHPMLRDVYLKRFVRYRLYAIDRIKAAGWRPRFGLGEALVRTWEALEKGKVHK